MSEDTQNLEILKIFQWRCCGKNTKSLFQTMVLLYGRAGIRLSQNMLRHLCIFVKIFGFVFHLSMTVHIDIHETGVPLMRTHTKLQLVSAGHPILS